MVKVEVVRDPWRLLEYYPTPYCHSTTRGHFQCFQSEIDLYSPLDKLAGRAIYLSLIHISEPTRQAEISYAVFCLKKKWQTSLIRRSGIPKLNGISLPQCAR